MAITLLTHTASVGASSGGTSPSINTTGATLLVAVVGAYGTSPTLTDSKSNTWTQLTQQGNSGVAWSRIWYCSNPTVGSGHTFTASATYGGVSVAAFAGTVTSSVFDAQTGSSAASPGSLTPAGDNELIICGWATNGDSTTNTINSGFTKLDGQEYVAAVSDGFYLAYKIQTSAAAVNPTVTATGATQISTVQAAFIAAASGAAVIYYNQLCQGA